MHYLIACATYVSNWHCLNLAISENIYFSYKLEPYNDEWETQDILQNNTLQFGGLKPGSYKLYLRVRNGFEPDQFGTTVLEFRILKPWYQSEWFYVLCVLGFAALVAGLVKWRTASITKRRKELQKLVDIQTESIAHTKQATRKPIDTVAKPANEIRRR